LKNGEIKLNASERLKEFTQGIQNYIDCKNLGPPKFTAEHVLPEMYTTENLEKLTQDECFNGAFMLHQYADYISSEKASQEVVIKWCEKALNTIISTETEDMSQYTKYEMKVAHVLKTHDLAKKIDEWKSVAEGRITAIGNKEYSVRKKADCLMEKGKKK
jgi:hypothetical protein